MAPTLNKSNSTAIYDGAPSFVTQSLDPEVHPDQKAGTKNVDFPNEKLSLLQLGADSLVIALPLLLLGFVIALSRLNGKEVDHTFATWTNAVTIVRSHPAPSLSSIAGLD